MLQRAGGILRDKPGGAATAHVFVFVTAVAVSYDRRDYARVGINPADPMVPGIGDIGVVMLIEHDRLGRMQHRFGGLLPVSIVPIPTNPGYGRNQACAPIDSPNPIAALVDHIDIPGLIDGDPDDVIKPCLARRFPIIKVHR